MRPDGLYRLTAQQREIDARESGYTEMSARGGHAARIRNSDRAARVIVADFLPGTLADKTRFATDPEIHLRAGTLLRAFHDQVSRPSEGTDAAATRRALAWLDSDHRIAPDIEARSDSCASRRNAPAQCSSPVREC